MYEDWQLEMKCVIFICTRESARRSRLRKQAELHEMIEEVQEFTIKNAALSLEVGHLRKSVASIRQQNMLFQVGNGI